MMEDDLFAVPEEASDARVGQSDPDPFSSPFVPDSGADLFAPPARASRYADSDPFAPPRTGPVDRAAFMEQLLAPFKQEAQKYTLPYEPEEVRERVIEEKMMPPQMRHPVIGPQPTEMVPQGDEFWRRVYGLEKTWRDIPYLGRWLSSFKNLGLMTVRGLVDTARMFGWDTEFSRAFSEELGKDIEEHYRHERVRYERALINHGLPGAVAETITTTAVDVATFIAAMALTKGLAARSGIPLFAKVDTATDIAKYGARAGTAVNSIRNAAQMAALRFAMQPGDFREKTNAAAVTMAFLSTTALSGQVGRIVPATTGDAIVRSGGRFLFRGATPNDFSAKFIDFTLNSALSIGLGKYKEALDSGYQEALARGDEENAWKYQLIALLPVVGTDAWFSSMTKSFATLEQQARAAYSGAVAAGVMDAPSIIARRSVMQNWIRNNAEKLSQPEVKQYLRVEIPEDLGRASTEQLLRAVEDGTRALAMAEAQKAAEQRAAKEQAERAAAERAQSEQEARDLRILDIAQDKNVQERWLAGESSETLFGEKIDARDAVELLFPDATPEQRKAYINQHARNKKAMEADGGLRDDLSPMTMQELREEARKLGLDVTGMRSLKALRDAIRKARVSKKGGEEHAIPEDKTRKEQGQVSEPERAGVDAQAGEGVLRDQWIQAEGARSVDKTTSTEPPTKPPGEGWVWYPEGTPVPAGSEISTDINSGVKGAWARPIQTAGEKQAAPTNAETAEPNRFSVPGASEKPSLPPPSTVTERTEAPSKPSAMSESVPDSAPTPPSRASEEKPAEPGKRAEPVKRAEPAKQAEPVEKRVVVRGQEFRVGDRVIVGKTQTGKPGGHGRVVDIQGKNTLVVKLDSGEEVRVIPGPRGRDVVSEDKFIDLARGLANGEWDDRLNGKTLRQASELLGLSLDMTRDVIRNSGTRLVVGRRVNGKSGTEPIRIGDTVSASRAADEASAKNANAENRVDEGVQKPDVGGESREMDIQIDELRLAIEYQEMRDGIRPADPARMDAIKKELAGVVLDGNPITSASRERLAEAVANIRASRNISHTKKPIVQSNVPGKLSADTSLHSTQTTRTSPIEGIKIGEKTTVGDALRRGAITADIVVDALTLVEARRARDKAKVAEITKRLQDAGLVGLAGLTRDQLTDLYGRVTEGEWPRYQPSISGDKPITRDEAKAQIREMAAKAGWTFIEDKTNSPTLGTVRIGPAVIRYEMAESSKGTAGEILRTGKYSYTVRIDPENGRVTTVAHEAGHIVRDLLNPAERRIVRDVLGFDVNDRDGDEAFARAMETPESRRELANKLRAATPAQQSVIVRVLNRIVSFLNATFGTNIKRLGSAGDFDRLAEGLEDFGLLRQLVTGERGGEGRSEVTQRSMLIGENALRRTEDVEATAREALTSQDKSTWREFLKWRRDNAEEVKGLGMSEAYQKWRQELRIQEAAKRVNVEGAVPKEIVDDAMAHLKRFKPSKVDPEREEVRRNAFERFLHAAHNAWSEWDRLYNIVGIALGKKMMRYMQELRHDYGEAGDKLVVGAEDLNEVTLGRNTLREALNAPEKRFDAIHGGDVRTGEGGERRPVRLSPDEQMYLATQYVAGLRNDDPSIKYAPTRFVLGGPSDGQASRVIHITLETLRQIHDGLTEAQRKVVYAYADYMDDVVYPAVNKVYRQHNGVDLPKREFYAAIRRDYTLAGMVGGKKPKMSAEEEKRYDHYQKLLEKLPLLHGLDPNNMAFLKKTKANELPIIVRGLTEVFLNSVKDAALYVKVNPIRDFIAATLIGTEDNPTPLSIAMRRSEIGARAYRYLKDFHDKIGGTINLGLDATDSLMEKYLGRATTVRLASPWVALKQPMSAPAAAIVFGAKYLMSGIKAFTHENMRFTDDIINRSNYFQRRIREVNVDVFFSDPSLTSARSALLAGRPSLYNRSQLLTAALMRAGDKTAMRMVIMMARDYVLDTRPDLKGEAFKNEVARQAAIAFQQTQVASDVLDRTMIERHISDPWKRMLAYMYGARGAMFNCITYSWRSMLQERSPENIRMFGAMLAGIGAQALGVAIVDAMKVAYRERIAKLNRSDESEEVYEKMARLVPIMSFENIASTIPFLGGGFASGTFAALYQTLGEKDVARLRSARVGQGGVLSTAERDFATILRLASTHLRYAEEMEKAKTYNQRRALKQRIKAKQRDAFRALVRYLSELYGIPVNQVLDMMPQP